MPRRNDAWKMVEHQWRVATCEFEGSDFATYRHVTITVLGVDVWGRPEPRRPTATVGKTAAQGLSRHAGTCRPLTDKPTTTTVSEVLAV